MSVFQICIVVIMGIILATMVKWQKPEYSVYLIIFISFFIFAFILTLINNAKLELSVLTGLVGGNEKFYIMLFKMMGITYLCEFCAGICKDAGYQGLAGQVEMFGKISILISGLPILLALVETLQNFSA